MYSAPVRTPHQLKLEDCEIVWVKFIFSETLWVWTSQIGYIKRKQSQKNTNKNKMSDKRRRRRKASDDSSGEEDEASITAVSFFAFFIYFIIVYLRQIGKFKIVLNTSYLNDSYIVFTL